MTYITGGNIQASDYNTLANNANKIYADVYSGATTLPNAGYGYGQTPLLSNVAIGETITAAQWSSLFGTLKKAGAHQGTTTIPPLPTTNPAPGDKIIAYTGVSALVSTLDTNRFNLALGQYSLVTGTPYIQTSATKPWINSLTFNYSVNFGSWDNARYFFNSGGKLQLNGSYTPISTPSAEEILWMSLLANMSPLVFNYNSTTPAVGTGGTAVGFYGLTHTGYTTLYTKTYSSGYYYDYYSANYVRVQAKLANAAGTNGIVEFSISMVDLESVHTKNPKTGTTTYRIDYISASGSSVSYPGSVTIAPIGIDNGFIKA